MWRVWVSTVPRLWLWFRGFAHRAPVVVGDVCLPRVEQRAQPKVRNLGRHVDRAAAVGLDHDVAGVEVAMHDVAAMQVRQPVRYVHEQREQEVHKRLRLAVVKQVALADVGEGGVAELLCVGAGVGVFGG